MDENSRERSHALKKLKLEEELERIYNHLYLLARKSGENHLLPDPKLLASLSKEMERFKVSDTSFRPELIRIHFWTLYHRITGNQPAVMDFQIKVYNLWDKWPQRIKADPNRYIDCLRGYMEVCLEQQNWSGYDLSLIHI